MSDETPKRSKSLATHVKQMPGWHQVILVLASVCFVAGVAGQAMGYFSKPAPEAAPAAVSGTHSSFAADGAPAASADPSQDETASIWTRWSPTFTRVGLAFILGFILGWAVRAFMKITGTLLILGIGAMLALSYFHILNVDMTKAEQEYQSGMAWITDQGERMAKTLYSHIPGSFSSFAGMFIGFRRK